MKYRKKPVVIEAVRLLWGNWSQVCEFVGEAAFDVGFIGGCRDGDGRYTWGDAADVSDQNAIAARITTLEGDMVADEGDWIIRGVKGELYPCKDDIFQMTYEEVSA